MRNLDHEFRSLSDRTSDVRRKLQGVAIPSVLPFVANGVGAGAWAGTLGRGYARPSGRLGVGSRPKVPVGGAKSASPPSTAPTAVVDVTY